MWGYAEGNATLVGIVVVVIGLAALIYVGMRISGRPGGRGKAGGRRR